MEHVFRVHADDLTPTGMADLLRVLMQPLDVGAGAGGSDDEDALFEEEEEEEDEAKEGRDEGEGRESGSVSSSEDEGEEDGSADEGLATAAAAEPKAVAAGAAGPPSGSESDSDVEAMGDDAMFRMDAALAATFSSMRAGARGSAGRRLAREELLHFKMRVAGLLDVFARRVPASPLLPAAAGPLLAALAAAARPGGHAGLAERLAGLLTNRVCKSRAEASGAAGAAGAAGAGKLALQLRAALYHASRSHDRRVVAAAGEAYVYLQRVAVGAGGAGDAGAAAAGLESARAAVADFFTKKRSRLGRPLLEVLLRRVPPLRSGLLAPLLVQAAGARSEYLRGEAWALLGAAARAAGSTDRLPPGNDPAGEQLAAALEAAVSGGGFGKLSRQADALRAAAALLEALGDAALPPTVRQRLVAAARELHGGAAATPKLTGALQRLVAVLEQQQKEGGKGAKALAGQAPASKEEKASQSKAKRKATSAPAVPKEQLKKKKKGAYSGL